MLLDCPSLTLVYPLPFVVAKQLTCFLSAQSHSPARISYCILPRALFTALTPFVPLACGPRGVAFSAHSFAFAARESKLPSPYCVWTLNYIHPVKSHLPHLH